MRQLIALGDSHLYALKLAAELGLLVSDRNEFCIVGGATAVGLRNPNSSTDALNIFKGVMETSDRSSYVLTHLGEVDCGFVIWWRAQKYNESVKRQFESSLLAYKKFIEDIYLLGYHKICITGASLPTIRDGVDYGDVANKRSEVKVSIHDRTQLTLAYNAELKDYATRSSIYFFDIADGILDNKKKIVSDFFRDPDPTDHHLDDAKICGMWALACNKFLHSR